MLCSVITPIPLLGEQLKQGSPVGRGSVVGFSKDKYSVETILGLSASAFPLCISRGCMCEDPSAFVFKIVESRHTTTRTSVGLSPVSEWVLVSSTEIRSKSSVKAGFKGEGRGTRKVNRL